MTAIDINSKRSRVKRPVKVHYKEYEEIHKRVQKTRGEHVKNSVGRKLYNPGESYENSD